MKMLVISLTGEEAVVSEAGFREEVLGIEDLEEMVLAEDFREKAGEEASLGEETLMTEEILEGEEGLVLVVLGEMGEESIELKGMIIEAVAEKEALAEISGICDYFYSIFKNSSM